MYDGLIKIPKIQLHLHLDGSLRPETVYKRLKEKPIDKITLNDWHRKGFISDQEKVFLIKLFAKDITLELIKKNLKVSRCRNLSEYLEKFILPICVLQDSKYIEESVYQLYEDLHKQGVIYAEVRFAPSKFIYNGLSYDEVIQSAIKGLNRAKKDFDIDGNLILCMMRGYDKSTTINNYKTLFYAKKYLNKGICAIDLAGAEALFKTEEFKGLFSYAKRLKVPFTIHAGEADGPKSIWDAIRFGTKRLGHGVRCVEDKYLVNYIKENEITLEVCIVSNLQTKSTKYKHPLERLYNLGVHTTINTDNDTVSNTNILNDYQYILMYTNLTIDDLIQMNKYAIESSFSENKDKLLEKLESEKTK